MPATRTVDAAVEFGEVGGPVDSQAIELAANERERMPPQRQSHAPIVRDDILAFSRRGEPQRPLARRAPGQRSRQTLDADGAPMRRAPMPGECCKCSRARQQLQRPSAASWPDAPAHRRPHKVRLAARRPLSPVPAPLPARNHAQSQANLRLPVRRPPPACNPTRCSTHRPAGTQRRCAAHHSPAARAHKIPWASC